MNRLYDSRGKHIANEADGELHELNGKNIGHFLTREAIFINMRGAYLGEIVMIDRLMRQRGSRHTSVNFGSRGSRGSLGNCGTPGNQRSIRQPGGYEDIAESLLG
jgi:hypothetical protein